jgi:integrase
MIRRRALAAEIETKIGNHSFRATGITAYLKNGGKLEIAQQMADGPEAVDRAYPRNDETASYGREYWSCCD